MSLFVFRGRKLGSIEERRRVRALFRIPDWRVPSAYPQASASGHRWAWEFLRRNDQFRAEHNELSQRLALVPREQRQASHSCFAEHSNFLADWGIDHWFPSAWLWGWPIQLGHDDESAEFVHMEVDAPCAFVTGPMDSTRYFDRPLRDTEYRVIFDASMPIAPQLAQVKAILESRQAAIPAARKTVRPRWGLFPRYLRAYDGFREMTDRGASETRALNELVDQFMSEKLDVDDIDYVQDARNALDAAHRYVQRDYRALPIMRG
ncbi:transcriptional regulator domain-containing protein [Burkholderia cenocepacia]|uniref:transcriptional regulator domain-containing protein n=1 Tax=Burkholderia cenocepacia TaxID=95486 RepID=UPI000F56C137|nr:DUF6499 domain-containing protein [Burkholderia cenocepacia]